MPMRPPVHRPAWAPSPEQARAERLRRLERERGTAKQRGYDSDWRRLRAAVLEREPLCRHCALRGKDTPAVEVHHSIPIRVRPDLRLVEHLLVPLCTPCHSVQTAEETKRYGRRLPQPG